MYIQGFVVPVPGEAKEAYIKASQEGWEIFSKLGAIEHVEAWEEDVRDGQYTDFRKSVEAKDGEIVVFSWVIWPDKQTCEAAHQKMMNGEMDHPEAMPFDGKRMIFGGFEPVFVAGRND